MYRFFSLSFKKPCYITVEATLTLKKRTLFLRTIADVAFLFLEKEKRFFCVQNIDSMFSGTVGKPTQASPVRQNSRRLTFWVYSV